MNILEALYNGHICPVENVIPSSPNYRPIVEEISKGREYFLSRLSDEDKKRFEIWNQKVFQYEEMVEYANFAYGFKLGIMLWYEVFQGRDVCNE